jgi:hypothetical protein
MRQKLTPADVAYVRANFVPLEEACAGRADAVTQVRDWVRDGLLPRPSYVLPDGTEMVPADYFALVDAAGGPQHLERYFASHYRGADLDEDWQAYLDGTYGVCLKQVTPETIVRKAELMAQIRCLLDDPRPSDAAWRAGLRSSVDELDALERPFSPDFDRRAFDVPPSRDRLIAQPRHLYPDIFTS